MEKLTGGQAVVKSLIKQGVELVFGLPGVQNDWLYNAFYDYQDEIKVIHTRHEQGTAYMALGYYLASGKVGVYSVVPGPGFLNASAALATAYGLNAKVLCLVGQIPTKTQGKGWSVLHEINDQMGIMKSLTKWADSAKSPADAPLKIAEAFQQLQSGRPRPVGVEVAMDVLEKQEDISNFGLLSPCKGQISDVEQNPKSNTQNTLFEEAARLLSAAKNPMIFVGSGAMDAGKEVLALAEALQAPVFSYRTGKGIVSSRHYLGHTLQAGHALWKTADVVIGIGSQVREPLLKWGHDADLKFISLNIDESVHTKILTPSVSLTSDAAEGVSKILEFLPKYNVTRPSREAEMLALKAKWKSDTAYLEPQTTYLKILREELPDDGIIVDELTQVGFATRMIWDCYQPRTYLCTGHMGTLGWGFSTALGAKVAKPNVPVVSITGDGGFMFTMQELATAVQHRIGLVVLLFNNNAYGNVQSMQQNLYGNKVIASDLHNPDFVKMAKSFGANAVKVTSFAAFRKALKKAMGQDLPTIIEIPIDKNIPSTDDFKALGKVR
ncbi:MAG: thiamine pyrophosphate-binding protein [Saprospiraceae bacterium]|nr:thiamine pyrophosphate-binding protein [Saprospiraceae bacterium]